MSAGPLVGKRVLVVEDEVLVAVMIEDMLTELGATVIGPAMSVVAGSALARQGDFDAAVLDVNVHGERVDPLADLIEQRHIPIVFATSYGDLMESSARGGIVLDKPFSREALASALSRALHRE